MITVTAGSILCRPHIEGLRAAPLTSQLPLFVPELLKQTLRHYARHDVLRKAVEPGKWNQEDFIARFLVANRY